MLYPSLPLSRLVASSLMVSAKCLDGNRKEMHRLRLVKLISYWGSEHNAIWKIGRFKSVICDC